MQVPFLAAPYPFMRAPQPWIPVHPIFQPIAPAQPVEPPEAVAIAQVQDQNPENLAVMGPLPLQEVIWQERQAGLSYAEIRTR